MYQHMIIFLHAFETVINILDFRNCFGYRITCSGLLQQRCMFSLILAPSVFRGFGSGNRSICGAECPSWIAADPWGSGTGFWRVYLCGLKRCWVCLCCGHTTGGRWEQDLSCITSWHNINITVLFIRNSFILCGLLFIELTVAVFLLLFQNFEAYVVHSMNQKPWTELSDFKQNTPISPWASRSQVEMFSPLCCRVWNLESKICFLGMCL